SSADAMSNRETPAFDPSGAGLDTQLPQAAWDRVKAANDLVRTQHARMVLPDLVVIQAQSRGIPSGTATDIVRYRTGGARHHYRLIGSHSVVWRLFAHVDRFRALGDPGVERTQARLRGVIPTPVRRCRT